MTQHVKHRKERNQVELNLRVKCECGSEKDVPISKINKSKENDPDLIKSIEQNSDGLFYCLQNEPNAFLLVCVMCGKDQSVYN